MSAISYKIIELVCVLGIVSGIRLMNSPKTARTGNLLGAACMLIAIITIMISDEIFSLNILRISLVLGTVIGCLLAVYVTMTRIPQLVALLNGSGGAASAIVAFVVLTGSSAAISGIARFTGAIALVVGSVTFGGSLVAVAKLDGKISPLPVVLRGHFILTFNCHKLNIWYSFFDSCWRRRYAYNHFFIEFSIWHCRSDSWLGDIKFVSGGRRSYCGLCGDCLDKNYVSRHE